MTFVPNASTPKLPFEVPDDIPIYEFLFNEKYGRWPVKDSYPAFTDGVTGKSYTADEVRENFELLARALSKQLGWAVADSTVADLDPSCSPIPNSELLGQKVLCVYSYNTIDTLAVSWAAHRLNGVSSPANAAYSAEELAYQLKDSGSKALFTHATLLPVALDAANRSGLPKDKIFLIDLPPGPWKNESISASGYRTVQDLIEEGSKLPKLDLLDWKKGQGDIQTAFLCYSSGTSGLPKGVMIQHSSVITNVLQLSTFDSPEREQLKKETGHGRLKGLGVLPFSHIYALVVVAHQSVYVGDEIVCLPKFDFSSVLKATSDHKLQVLYLVPPIIILMTKNKERCDKYDLSNVRTIWTGAAPLGLETVQDLIRLWPTWIVRQGYGMTESGPSITSTAFDDVDFGSVGCILPAYEARIVSEEGVEIKEYDTPGELIVKSKTVVMGYLNNPKANKETFQNGWLRTGDKALIRKSPKGNEHVWIVDRVKEMIKVNGLQVAPAELEAYLLTHPAVADVAVISIPDDFSGEVPKAYVVKAPSVGLEESDAMLIRSIKRYVEKNKSKHKWLRGGVEFIDVVPKSPSGKILRRLLRDKEKEKRRQAGSKL